MDISHVDVYMDILEKKGKPNLGYQLLTSSCLEGFGSYCVGEKAIKIMLDTIYNFGKTFKWKMKYYISIKKSLKNIIVGE